MKGKIILKILVITLKLRADNQKQPQTKQDMIVKLQDRIKQLETEKKDLEAFYGKVIFFVFKQLMVLVQKKNNVEAFKELNEKFRISEEEKAQTLARLKKSEEKFTQLKMEFDDVWKKFLEKEKSYKQLQLEVKNLLIGLKSLFIFVTDAKGRRCCFL